MAILQTQRFCRLCNMRTLHVRTTLGLGWGCFLTIITAGLFLPVWIVIAVKEGILNKWRCQQCGRGRHV